MKAVTVWLCKNNGRNVRKKAESHNEEVIDRKLQEEDTLMLQKPEKKGETERHDGYIQMDRNVSVLCTHASVWR